MPSIRSKLATVAAIGAASLSAAAIAGAATSGTTSTTSSGAGAQSSATSQPAQRDPSQGGHTLNGKTEQLLTGEVAAKVRAAALAKVPGTVERVETNVDTATPYEAHITKSDGSQVIVEVNSDYSVAKVSEMGAGGQGGPGPAA